MGEHTPDPKKLYETLGALRKWADEHHLDDAKDRIGRMMISGSTTKRALTLGDPDAPLPAGANEKVMGAMSTQLVNALEGCIQIAHKIKEGRTAIKDNDAIMQMRVVHSWAHELSEEKKLPFTGKKKGSAKHKIEYLGQRLQQLEFGNPAISGGSSAMGARYQPSSFAGRSGDALFEKEMQRDDDERTP